MKYFGMFSDAGNAKVAEIVEWAIVNRAEWTDVLPVLNNLARSDYAAFGEANDTAVREAVYDACNFTCAFYA
jgi:hypothetical protein